MATVILKNSSVAAKVPLPGDLVAGELAINTADGKIYMKNSGGTVIDVGTTLALNTTDLGTLFQAFDQHIIPDTDITYDLGSPTKQWRDIYVGPGSFYVNGQKVLEDSSGTIVLSADLDQNVQIKSSGTGDVELLPAGSGVIQAKGTLSILAGENVTSSDSNAISIAVPLNMNGEVIGSLAAPVAGTDATTKTYVDDLTTAAALLAKIVTVDGNGSGLDADTLDGLHHEDFLVIDGTHTMTGNLDMGSLKIVNLADGVAGNDAVTKNQLDNAQAGLLVKDQCRVATTTTLPSNVAAGSGVGKTITAAGVGILTIDGVATVLGDRIFVKNQANAADNGIYEVTTEGTAGVAFILTRATDYDGSPTAEVKAGTFAFIDEGTVNGKTGWTLTETGLTGGGSPVEAVVDTDNLLFAQFQGLPSYTAGTNLTLVGSQFNVDDAFISNVGDSIAGNLTPSVNNTYNLGSGALNFANVYATTFVGEATSAQYADLAEIYSADADIEPGTVVCFGGEEEVTTCMHDMDRRVAGIVSTNPAYLMNSEADGVAVALRGRVPCKVSGTVAKGDMMVSDGNGGARAEENPAMGSVIGKALADSEGDNVIEIVVG